MYGHEFKLSLKSAQCFLNDIVLKISLFDWSILMSFVWSIRVYRQWKIIALFNCCLPSLRFLLFFFFRLLLVSVYGVSKV